MIRMSAGGVRRPVSAGRVQCPLRGDIDIERCFGCPWLENLEIDAADPGIRCRPAAARIRPLSSDLQWPRSAAPAA